MILNKVCLRHKHAVTINNCFISYVLAVPHSMWDLSSPTRD